MALDPESLSFFLGSIIALIATVVIAKIIDSFLKGYFSDVAEKLNVDKTTYALLRRMIVAIILLGGLSIALYLIPQVRSFSISLFAGAGFAGIVIGFAAQKTVSNIISGIFIAIFRPFRVGDILLIHDEYGSVEDITLYHTVIKTWENKRLIIPNSIISDESIVNWSIRDLPVLWHVDFNISYDSDIDLARSIILDEINNHKKVMHDRNPGVLVVGLEEFSVLLRSTFWVPDRPTAWGTGCEIRESVKKRFSKEGIEIPVPYRMVVFKKDLKN